MCILKNNRRHFNVFASFSRDGIDSTVKNNLLRGPIICTNSKCILILEIDTIHAVIYNETLQAHSHNLSPIIGTLAVRALL